MGKQKHDHKKEHEKTRNERRKKLKQEGKLDEKVWKKELLSAVGAPFKDARLGGVGSSSGVKVVVGARVHAAVPAARTQWKACEKA